MNIAGQTLRIGSKDIWSALNCAAPPPKEPPKAAKLAKRSWQMRSSWVTWGALNPQNPVTSALRRDRGETQRSPREDRGRPWRDVAPRRRPPGGPPGKHREGRAPAACTRIPNYEPMRLRRPKPPGGWSPVPAAPGRHHRVPTPETQVLRVLHSPAGPRLRGTARVELVWRGGGPRPLVWVRGAHRLS